MNVVGYGDVHAVSLALRLGGSLALPGYLLILSCCAMLPSRREPALRLEIGPLSAHALVERVIGLRLAVSDNDLSSEARGGDTEAFQELVSRRWERASALS